MLCSEELLRDHCADPRARSATETGSSPSCVVACRAVIRFATSTGKGLTSPAAEAEVDFGEFAASIAGQVIKLYMFLPAAIAFGKGVPHRQCQPNPRIVSGWACASVGGLRRGAARVISYDNLKAGVIRIALGRERCEHPRFVPMRSAMATT